MGKLADRIIFGLAVIVITFAWSYYLFENLLTALLTTAVVFILTKTAYAFYRSRRRSLGNITSYEMCAAFALMGSGKAAEHIYNALPENMREGIEGQFFIMKKDGKRILVMVNYKFTNVNEEDVAKLYRKCKEKDIKDAMLLSRVTDRKVMVFGARLDINIRYPDRRILRKFLIDKNAMPAKISAEKKIKTPVNFKELLYSALDRRRIKYYVFVGLTLFIMSFFTPLKLYYLIISSVPLLLAAASALFSIKES